MKSHYNLIKTTTSIIVIISTLFLYQLSFASINKNKSKKMPKTTNTLQTNPDNFTCYGTTSSDLTGIKQIIDRIKGIPIVFIGEKHNQYADHILQLRIIKALYKNHKKLAVGMEMFQRKFQPVINEYMDGKIDKRTFLKKTEYLKRWGYNYLMYRPIIQFCKKHHLPLVALNAPSEVARKVSLKGLKSLTKAERKQIPKHLIFPCPAYKKLLRKIYKIHSEFRMGSFKDFCQAQTVWDQTMAQSIVDFAEKHPNYQIVALTGSGHVIFGYGIPSKVKQQWPLKQTIVINVHGDKVSPKMADFFLFPPEIKQPYSPKLGVLVDETKIDGHNYLKIVNVIPHTPAWKVGLKAGYLILAFDGKPIHNIYDLRLDLLFKHEGDTAIVKVKKIRTILPDEIFNIKVGPFKENSMTDMLQNMTR